MMRMPLTCRVLAGIMMFTSLAAAQEQALLEEIVVTAERRQASLQEVPIAVSALSTTKLENLQIKEAADLQRYVPSLNMFNNITSPTNLSPSMRGSLQQDASLVVAESPFGIYVDDIYVGRLNGNNVTLSDIERVEVLRGPQGTLYGRNTAAGAIKFISRTPGEENWFDFTAGFGNDEQRQVSFSVGGPFNDAWAGSFAAQYKHKDGQYFNVAEDVETGLQESVAFRGKLRYMGGERLDAVFSVSYSDSDNDSLQLVNGITPGVPDSSRFNSGDLVLPNGEFTVNTPFGLVAPAPLTSRPTAETKQVIAGLNIAYDLNDNLTFRSITGYVGLDDAFSTDFNGNSAATAAFVGASEPESDQFTQEFQLVGTGANDRLDYLVGAFFLQEDAEQAFAWNFVTPLSTSLIDTEVDSVSVFGEASYQFTERLKGTAGVRWTDDEKDFDFLFERLPGNLFDIAIAPGFFPPITETIQLEGSYSEVTPKLGLDYTFDIGSDSGLLYFQAAKGFKGGGFSAIALASTAPVGVYEPETNWTYELGLKADWLDSRLRTNLAYFFADIEEIQQNATVVGAGFEFPVQNSGDAEIKGLEFEITAVPAPGLNIFLSGSLLDGEYTRLNPNSAAAAARITLGVEPLTPQTADYAINVGFDYTFDWPGEVIDDVSFGLDYYEIDDYITSATNEFFNSGWDTLNGFVSVGFGENWRLRLSGKNLADDTIVTSGSRGLGGFIFLPPREVLLTLTYRM